MNRLEAIKTLFLKLLLVAFCMPIAENIHAHETPIALLVLNEKQVGVFGVEWNYSSSTNRFPPEIVFPDQCEWKNPLVICGEQGLFGRLKLEKLGERYSAAVIQIDRLDESTQSYTLTAANSSITLTRNGKIPATQIAASYIPLGVEHILLGVDHLLFVLGLMLLVSNYWSLLKTITAFTIAHSITLAATTLGILGISEDSVNAAIALSIVFIAVEVIKNRGKNKTWSARFPWAVAFGFGLLHGFGFSGALTNAGLSAENLPAALLFFNIGVELGQIGFVLFVLTLIWCHKTLNVLPPKWARVSAIYSIGGIASFWFFTRALMLSQ